MSAIPVPRPTTIWKDTPVALATLAVAGLVLALAFLPGLKFMVQVWGDVEEYSYGYMIPFIVAFLLWQKSDKLREATPGDGRGGLALIALALLLHVAGGLSAIKLLMQYGFVVGVFGLAVCQFGWRGARVVAVPLAMLFFMIPLPQFFMRELSQHLQLLSSQIGVALIRLFGISVFLEGNVIDLGTLKLQVVEACSGLRYLFPLMTLGFLAAYFFRVPMWQRLLLFASTIPMTILINSLRIGIIGVTVEYWGKSMAEGLLHDFEGWFMFMICMVLLLLEMVLLTRLGKVQGGGRKRFGDVFALDFPAPPARDANVAARRPTAALRIALALLVVFALAIGLAPKRGQDIPARQPLSGFPLQLGDWRGTPDRLDADVAEVLAFTDYTLANYRLGQGAPVNFYVSYYASQSGGEGTHSPRTCLPGDGWEIGAFSQVVAASVPVNRVLIARGDQRQLVYYWFKQRDRRLTSEIAVKWYIFSDGITRRRSDGALVRLITPLAPGEAEADADRRLSAFLREADARLTAYVPD